MTKPIVTNPTADLPTNWATGETVAPTGAEVGLTAQHGYNYLMGKVNEGLTDIGALNDAFEDAASEDYVDDAVSGVPVPKIYSNKVVQVAGWSADATYAGFGYRASVSCSGATAAMVPEVIFSPADASSGIYAPVATSYAGGVYIYASAVPPAAITIPTILLLGGDQA